MDRCYPTGCTPCDGPIDFPENPSDGQRFCIPIGSEGNTKCWVWDACVPAWRAEGPSESSTRFRGSLDLTQSEADNGITRDTPEDQWQGNPPQPPVTDLAPGDWWILTADVAAADVNSDFDENLAGNDYSIGDRIFYDGDAYERLAPPVVPYAEAATEGLPLDANNDKVADPDPRTGGIVKLATVEQVQAGVNKCDPVTPYTLAEGIPDLLGLLTDVNTIYYVAAAIGDVPDADVKADGTTLGDTRTTAQRKAATYCANIRAAFDRINNRTSITGRNIIIRLYTSTNTADECNYTGNTNIRFTNGRDLDAVSTNTHTASRISVSGSANLQLYCVNIRTEGGGFRSLNNIFIGGGVYELNSSTEGYHILFLAAKRLDLELHGVNGASASVTLTNNGSVVNSGYFAEIIVAEDVRIDTRYTAGGARPAINWNFGHTGTINTSFIRVRSYFQLYNDQSLTTNDFGYDFNVNITSATIQNVWFIASLTESVTPNVEVFESANANSFTCTVACPNTVTRFAWIEFPKTSTHAAFTATNNFMAFELPKAFRDASTGITDDSSFIYDVGAASVINNVFKETGETRDLNSTNPKIN
jgi:hypothetical protein